jgi:5'(3')-deoxyribonucleotidase
MNIRLKYTLQNKIDFKMEKKYVIAVDVDGVIRHMDHAFMEMVRKDHPESIKSEVHSAWDFPNIDLPTQKKKDIMFEEYPKEIFEDSPKYDNAYEDYLNLNRWAKNNNSRLVCATTQYPHLIHHTLIWLGKHKFNFNEIHVTREKHNLLIDFLIDDSPDNFEAWVKAGRHPSHFILVDRDWNKEVDAPTRVKSLGDAMKTLDVLLTRDRLKRKVLDK